MGDDVTPIYDKLASMLNLKKGEKVNEGKKKQFLELLGHLLPNKHRAGFIDYFCL